MWHKQMVFSYENPHQHGYVHVSLPSFAIPLWWWSPSEQPAQVSSDLDWAILQQIDATQPRSWTQLAKMWVFFTKEHLDCIKRAINAGVYI